MVPSVILVKHQPHIDRLAAVVASQHLLATSDGATVAALLGITLSEFGQHREEALAQSLPLDEGPVLVEILFEKVTPVKGMGGLVGGDGLGQSPVFLVAPAPLSMGLELDGINPAIRLGIEGVAALDGEDVRVRVVRVKHAPQLADAHVEAAAGGVGVVVGPEHVNKPVAGNDVTTVGQEDFKDGSVLPAPPLAGRDEMVAAIDLEFSQEVDREGRHGPPFSLRRVGEMSSMKLCQARWMLCGEVASDQADVVWRSSVRPGGYA